VSNSVDPSQLPFHPQSIFIHPLAETLDFLDAAVKYTHLFTIPQKCIN